MTRQRSDAGMTLAELLLSIAILGIIIGPVASSIILVLKSSASATNRLDTSHDAQIIDVYLTSDVAASADSSTSNNGVDSYFPAVTTANPPPQCGFTPSGFFTGIATFHWRDADAASPTGQSDKYAWYYVTRSAANVAPGVLHRSFCSVSNAATPALVGTVRDYTLARDISSSDPAISCGTGNCTNATFGSGSAPPSPPANVTVSVALVSGDSSTTVNVQGVRRVT